MLFYLSRAHRYLHSFPTRRSSDLTRRQASALAMTAASGWFTSWAMEAVISPSIVTRVRSEEHTSELQSHVNLVCRLLLEKKNLDHTGLFLTRSALHPSAAFWRLFL